MENFEVNINSTAVINLYLQIVEDTIETILVKGAVVINKISNIKNHQNNKTIVLRPGQKVLIFKDEITQKVIKMINGKYPAHTKFSSLPARKARKEMVPEISKTEVETSWKAPSWVIQGEELKDLLVKIGRRYNVRIDLKDKKLVTNKFSAIENENLEQVFELR